MDQINIRKQRSIKEKIYLIEINGNEYLIMGSSGNVYTITINNTPSCTCPDYLIRKTNCKHLYFVLDRVLGVTDIGIDKNIMADEKIKIKYRKLEQQKIKNKKIDDDKLDDICPLCLDELENGEELDWCKAMCGKYVHKSCFVICSRAYQAKCPYCRHPWYENNVHNYINLLI